jgi:hypothetical protein
MRGRWPGPCKPFLYSGGIWTTLKSLTRLWDLQRAAAHELASYLSLLTAAEGKRNQTREAVMEGCMSKSGYVYAPVAGTASGRP